MMSLTDYKCWEKKEEEDLPVLNITLTHQYNDSKTTYKSMEEDWLQPPETILTTQGSTERKQPETKMGRKTTQSAF